MEAKVQKISRKAEERDEEGNNDRIRATSVTSKQQDKRTDEVAVRK